MDRFRANKRWQNLITLSHLDANPFWTEKGMERRFYRSSYIKQMVRVRVALLKLAYDWIDFFKVCVHLNLIFQN